jgi:hypothetical protein
MYMGGGDRGQQHIIQEQQVLWPPKVLAPQQDVGDAHEQPAYEVGCVCFYLCVCVCVSVFVCLDRGKTRGMRTSSQRTRWGVCVSICVCQCLCVHANQYIVGS